MSDAYRRFAEVDSILSKALAVPSGEREAYVEAACSGDVELREVVLRLLEAAEDDESPLERRSGLVDLGSRAAALAREEEDRKLAPGGRFGAYEIVGSLGAGGMGEVYRARDGRLGRDVAIKALPVLFGEDPERLARLEREARLLAALNHPHINTIHELEEADDGRKALVLELVEGPTLDELLAKGPAPVPQALAWAKQIAEALEAAHERGVLHRDLKPANIKIADGQVKVLDFGLAVSVEPSAGGLSATPARTAVMTREGGVFGTAPYMSPEQWRGEPAKPGSDLWAFGCTLYEMLSSVRAFSGDTAAETAAAVLEREPDWSALPAETPRRVRDLLRGCLEKRVEDRLGDARMARAELERALTENERTSARSRGGWVLAALGVTALGTLGLWRGALEQSTRPEPRDAIDSIAVLPFENASLDPEDEYLSDGFTESLINALSKVPDLRVVPRALSFRYKGKVDDPVAVAAELGVRALLTGRLGERDGTLSLRAELTDAVEVAQLWGGQYHRPGDDLVEIREELVGGVVEALRLDLTDEQARRALDPATENPAAFRLYLRSSYYTFKLSREGLDRGLEYARQAVELDPGFALAYVALSQAHMSRAFLGFGSWDEAGDRSRAAVRRALELDETLPVAHVELGYLRHHFEWDWNGAEEAFARAVELDPTSAEALQGHAEALLSLRRVDEAIARAREAVKANPFSPHVQFFLALCYYHARRFDEASRANRDALELAPGHMLARTLASRILLVSGREEQAIAALREQWEEEGSRPERSLPLAFYLARAGRREDSRRTLRLTGDIPLEQLDPFRQEARARTLAELGETDRAFAILERMVAERSRGLLFLGTDPLWRSVRDEPRFDEILRRMGLPVESAQ